MAQAKRRSTSSNPGSGMAGGSGFRPLVGGVVLFVALSGTALLLRAVSPEPLTPDTAGRLLAATYAAPASGPGTGDEDPFAVLLETRRPPEAGAWQRVIIRASGTDAGDATTLAHLARQHGIAGPPDHFVIGNGRGCGDGEVQFTPRWDDQRPSALPGVPPAQGAGTLSICLIGDFSRTGATDAQMDRLVALLRFLHDRLEVPREGVVVAGEMRAGRGALDEALQTLRAESR